jgi:hypothetical protein
MNECPSQCWLLLLLAAPALNNIPMLALVRLHMHICLLQLRFAHPAPTTHPPPQVLPTSLTQLRLSYETNELGEDPGSDGWSDVDMDDDSSTDGDSADEEARQQYAHIRPKR